MINFANAVPIMHNITNSQRIESFTFVTASSLLRLIQPHFIAVACSVSYGKVTPSMTEQRHR
ncbi:hypothetical protein T12_12996 [Trichinella patagoniensis]|uniref:Uncharacterized protein n=1 Tax=Trichinella patagoniensis TaxID=990121 RepID=A0A0V1A7G5_9BILA|nr:hypothetical protein T12_12996 [Trichinella patagoniensis]